ncbi:MAG: rRNA pseudouridine synthase [Anaerolineae bacterium]|nr:rRNA pseudouridine synthase [Anaerolineae bacterium]
MEERLQKILARAGFGSRRACEELIRQGRVALNGQVAQLGQKADPNRDHITVDGKPVQTDRPRTYVALHKPRGVLSDEGDGSGRLSTARDLVSLPGRLFPVGRLDLRSEGLILLTDDGDLAYHLTHPRFGHEKEYRALVEGEPDAATLRKWRRGVFLDGKRTAPAGVTVARQEKGTTWLRVILREGRKRQIRRVAAMLGHPVHRLIRVRIGSLRLGDLRPGQWRRLTGAEVKALRSAAQKSPQKSRKGKPAS